MSRTVTASDMIASIREAADMVGSTFRTDTQILSMINNAAPELWGLVIDNYGDEYLKKTISINTVVGTVAYLLEDPRPIDFFKVLRVLVNFGNGRMYRCERFNPDERASYSTLNRNWLTTLPRYFVSGEYIEFEYAPQAVHPVTVVYVPSCPVLASGTSFDGYNGWERYVICKVAAQLLAEEESDNSALLMELASLKARIEHERMHRDEGQAPTIALTRMPRYARGRRLY